MARSLPLSGLCSLRVVMEIIITRILPKTVTRSCCLPGTVLAALHTPCVVHLLAAKMEGAINRTGGACARPRASVSHPGVEGWGQLLPDLALQP